MNSGSSQKMNDHQRAYIQPELQILYLLAVLINKVIGLTKGKPFTLHGSLFCFKGGVLLKGDKPIFNDKSFLYGEELEFGCYVKSIGAEIVDCNTVASHTSHAATAPIVKDRSKFIAVWSKSFLNWKNRWF